MVTWAGAFVEASRQKLEALAPKYRLELTDGAGRADGRWLYVEAGVNGAHLAVPRFCQALSHDLHCAVVGFLLQSTASIEDIEHFRDGLLVRKLAYSGDEGGWMTAIGSAQAWESGYFFAPGEGIDEGQEWPSNLDDEVSEETLGRYRDARAQGSADAILDLLSAGSPRSIVRLAQQFDVDLERPFARFTPPKSWKPRLILAIVALFLIAAFATGALTAPARPSRPQPEILEQRNP